VWISKKLTASDAPMIDLFRLRARIRELDLTDGTWLSDRVLMSDVVRRLNFGNHYGEWLFGLHLPEDFRA
jgi:hypothetical protein